MLKYDKILPFHNTNYTIALLNGKSGLINLDGKPLTEFIYDDLSEYHYDKESKEIIWFAEQEKYCVMRLNNKWGVLNDKGKIVIDFKYDKEIEIRKTGNSLNYIIRFDNRKYGFYDANLKQIIENKLSYIRETSHENRFYFSKSDGSKGLIDEKGNILFQSTPNAEIQFWLGYNNNENGILIQKNKLWGFLDFNGNLKIDFMYEYLHSTNSNLLIAKSTSGNFGVVDEENNIILDFKYEKIFDCYRSNDEIYFIAVISSTQKLLNSKGKCIL